VSAQINESTHWNITRKLAKLPVSSVELKYYLPVIKKIDSGDVRTTRMPDQVLDSSILLIRSAMNSVAPLVTDGYAAYARYAEKSEGIIHAQCWVHSRRYLVNAKESSPQEVVVVLEIIGQLYQLEKHIIETKLSEDKNRKYRLENSKPLVEEVFFWLNEQCQRHDLPLKHPLTKAINYLQARETELRVF
jgi:hypothetical protein